MNVFAREIDHDFIREFLARLAKLDAKTCDSFLRHARDADGCADTCPLDKTGDHSRAVSVAQAIHFVSFSLAGIARPIQLRGRSVTRPFPGALRSLARCPRARQHSLACRALGVLTCIVLASFRGSDEVGLPLQFLPRNHCGIGELGQWARWHMSDDTIGLSEMLLKRNQSRYVFGGLLGCGNGHRDGQVARKGLILLRGQIGYALVNEPLRQRSKNYVYLSGYTFF